MLGSIYSHFRESEIVLALITASEAFVRMERWDTPGAPKWWSPYLDNMPPRERNFVRMVFTNPRVKDLYYDWEAMARSSVAILRMQAVDNPSDPRLAALVGEMSVVSPQFRRWWADRHIARPNFGTI